MQLAVLLVILLCSLVPAAAANPGPCIEVSLDETGRLLLVPDEGGTNPHPEASFHVIVWDQACQNLIVGAVVEVIIYGLGDGRVQLCDHAELTKTTNQNGTARFNIPGGGCSRGTEVVSIRVNGVGVREYYYIMSPDYAGWDSEGLAGYSDLLVDPIDLSAFIRAYQGGTGQRSCHDYNNDWNTDPLDLAVFVEAWSGGSRDCHP
jgi:hypothetical protein